MINPGLEHHPEFIAWNIDISDTSSITAKGSRTFLLQGKFNSICVIIRANVAKINYCCYCKIIFEIDRSIVPNCSCLIESISRQIITIGGALNGSSHGCKLSFQGEGK